MNHLAGGYRDEAAAGPELLDVWWAPSQEAA